MVSGVASGNPATLSNEKDQDRDPRARCPLMFQKDKDIANTWYYKLFVAISMFFGRHIHGINVRGEEHIPTNGPALIIGQHTTHNTDIYLGLSYVQSLRGRVVRAMLHSSSGFVSCITNRFGGAPGDRNLAHELLKDGNLVAILPGGLEETFLHMTANGKHAYTPWWVSNKGAERYGFVRIAQRMGPGFKILPVVFENGEEMKWNPVFDLWCLFRLDVLYGLIMRRAPGPLQNVMYWVGLSSWISLSHLSFIVPVKVTIHVGEPVEVRDGETVEELRERVREGMVEIVRRQGRTCRNYSAGLSQRWLQMRAKSK